ncbi:hypothetical protein EVAR_14754_1 [Eumeta japonica]|uniref:Uncharacterized protein n=1 Tax=Eumeta variegata TaxID=151549 RepID=A0A4C1TWD1_EUMVA|nr:hypothetical protein EVAR_14754_1 [Eumeta japonica]
MITGDESWSRPSESDFRRVEFRPIESKRLGSQNLSSIGSCTAGTVMLFSDIDFGRYRNERRYQSPLNDYRLRSVALSS